MRHRFDAWSLLLGLLLGTVAVAGLNRWITTDLLAREWLLPAGLVLAGLLLGGVVAAVAGGRPRARGAASRDEDHQSGV